MNIQPIQASMLSALPPFSALPEDERNLLLQRLPRRAYSARAVIAATGRNDCGLYFLLSGRAKLTMGDDQGRQVTLASMQAGHVVFKEMELFGAPGGVLLLTATERCQVLYMSQSEVAACIEAHPRAALLLVSELARNLRSAYEKTASFAFDDVRTRLAHTLLDYARLHGHTWTVAVGSEELARIVGASREMVSRVLRNMEAIGLVRRIGRRIIVSDRDALRDECIRARPNTGKLLGQVRAQSTTKDTAAPLGGL